MSNTNDETTTTPTGLILSAKTYNRLKWFTLIFLPAFSALYFGLGAVVPLPFVTQVVGISAVVAVFLGAVVGISNSNFQKNGADGSINAVINGDNVDLSRLSLPEITADELAGKKQIVIQVNPTSSQ